MDTVIKWVTYEGNPTTRPHSLRDVVCKRSREVLSYQSQLKYLVKRATESLVEAQAFFLLPLYEQGNNGRAIFKGWMWESAGLTRNEALLHYPLQPGDQWAAWPLGPREQEVKGDTQ